MPRFLQNLNPYNVKYLSLYWVLKKKHYFVVKQVIPGTSTNKLPVHTHTLHSFIKTLPWFKINRLWYSSWKKGSKWGDFYHNVQTFILQFIQIEKNIPYLQEFSFQRYWFTLYKRINIWWRTWLWSAPLYKYHIDNMTHSKCFLHNNMNIHPEWNEKQLKGDYVLN